MNYFSNETPSSPSADTAEEDQFPRVTFQDFWDPPSSYLRPWNSCQGPKLPSAKFNIYLLRGGPRSRQPGAVIGGPVLRDRRPVEEPLNHLDIHQEVATQKAAAAVSPPIH